MGRPFRTSLASQHEDDRPKNQAFLKQLSTLSSISQEEFPLGNNHHHRTSSNVDGNNDQQQQPPQQQRRRAQPMPPPPGPPPANMAEAPGGRAGRRAGGVGQLSSAGVEVYVGQLKTLLKEAKEELKVRLWSLIFLLLPPESVGNGWNG